MDYHDRMERAKHLPVDGVPSPSKAEIAAELRRLAALLDSVPVGDDGTRLGTCLA